MAPRNAKLWPLDDHSRGKHLVLKEYLNAWLPIMATQSGKLLFIDGFAGPGEYLGGEPGSPIIALRCLREQTFPAVRRAEIHLFFIEAKPSLVAHLRQLVEVEKTSLPPNWHAEVVPGKFEGLRNTLDQLDVRGSRMAPAFVMVDPFGVTGVPMELLSRILTHPKSEVYISFMYPWMYRFRGLPSFQARLDELFGTPDWREAIAHQDPKRRREAVYDLYRDQLKRGGARHVVRFEVYRGNRLIYAVFFATKNWKGTDRMKAAIWKIDPTGGFSFRGARSGQLEMDITEFEPLREALREHFGNGRWSTIETIEEFVGSDQTDYYVSQLRTHGLIPMEQAGEVEAKGTTRARRAGKFPKGTLVRVLPRT